MGNILLALMQQDVSQSEPRNNARTNSEPLRSAQCPCCKYQAPSCTAQDSQPLEPMHLTPYFRFRSCMDPQSHKQFQNRSQSPRPTSCGNGTESSYGSRHPPQTRQSLRDHSHCWYETEPNTSQHADRAAACCKSSCPAVNPHFEPKPESHYPTSGLSSTSLTPFQGTINSLSSFEFCNCHAKQQAGGQNKQQSQNEELFTTCSQSSCSAFYAYLESTPSSGNSSTCLAHKSKAANSPPAPPANTKTKLCGLSSSDSSECLCPHLCGTYVSLEDLLQTGGSNAPQWNSPVSGICHQKNAETVKSQSTTREFENERQKALIRLLKEIAQQVFDEETIVPSTTSPLPKNCGENGSTERQGEPSTKKEVKDSKKKGPVLADKKLLCGCCSCSSGAEITEEAKMTNKNSYILCDPNRSKVPTGKRVFHSNDPEDMLKEETSKKHLMLICKRNCSSKYSSSESVEDRYEKSENNKSNTIARCRINEGYKISDDIREYSCVKQQSNTTTDRSTNVPEIEEVIYKRCGKNHGSSEKRQSKKTTDRSTNVPEIEEQGQKKSEDIHDSSEKRQLQINTDPSANVSEVAEEIQRKSEVSSEKLPSQRNTDPSTNVAETVEESHEKSEQIHDSSENWQTKTNTDPSNNVSKIVEDEQKKSEEKYEPTAKWLSKTNTDRSTNVSEIAEERHKKSEEIKDCCEKRQSKSNTDPSYNVSKIVEDKLNKSEEEHKPTEKWLSKTNIDPRTNVFESAEAKYKKSKEKRDSSKKPQPKTNINPRTNVSKIAEEKHKKFSEKRELKTNTNPSTNVQKRLEEKHESKGKQYSVASTDHRTNVFQIVEERHKKSNDFSEKRKPKTKTDPSINVPKIAEGKKKLEKVRGKEKQTRIKSHERPSALSRVNKLYSENNSLYDYKELVKIEETKRDKSGHKCDLSVSCQPKSLAQPCPLCRHTNTGECGYISDACQTSCWTADARGPGLCLPQVPEPVSLGPCEIIGETKTRDQNSRECRRPTKYDQQKEICDSRRKCQSKNMCRSDAIPLVPACPLSNYPATCKRNTSTQTRKADQI